MLVQARAQELPPLRASVAPWSAHVPMQALTARLPRCACAEEKAEPTAEEKAEEASTAAKETEAATVTEPAPDQDAEAVAHASKEVAAVPAAKVAWLAAEGKAEEVAPAAEAAEAEPTAAERAAAAVVEEVVAAAGGQLTATLPIGDCEQKQKSAEEVEAAPVEEKAAGAAREAEQAQAEPAAGGEPAEAMDLAGALKLLLYQLLGLPRPTQAPEAVPAGPPAPHPAPTPGQSAEPPAPPSAPDPAQEAPAPPTAEPPLLPSAPAPAHEAPAPTAEPPLLPSAPAAVVCDPCSCKGSGPGLGKDGLKAGDWLRTLDGERRGDEVAWHARLSPEQFRVLRMKGTEEINSGEYNDHFADGVYSCAGCSRPLYLSSHKYKSGHGWPAFVDNLDGALTRIGTRKVEIVCSGCQGHVGHVFKSSRYPPPKRERPSGGATCLTLPVNKHNYTKRKHGKIIHYTHQIIKLMIMNIIILKSSAARGTA